MAGRAKDVVPSGTQNFARRPTGNGGTIIFLWAPGTNITTGPWPSLAPAVSQDASHLCGGVLGGEGVRANVSWSLKTQTCWESGTQKGRLSGLGAGIRDDIDSPGGLQTVGWWGVVCPRGRDIFTHPSPQLSGGL